MTDPLSQRIYDAFTAHAELVALVGSRIYYGVPAQDVSQPQLSFMINSDMTIGSLEGELQTDMQDASVEINAWAPDNVVAGQVAKQAIRAMDQSERFFCDEFTSREDFDSSDKHYNVEIDAMLSWYPER